MSINNIGFYEDLTKIIFQLSSNTHLISSSDVIVILPGQAPLQWKMLTGYVLQTSGKGISSQVHVL